MNASLYLEGTRSPDEGVGAGIDYKQLCCAIIHNAILALEYAARDSGNETSGVCRGCRIKRPKWGRCPKCGLKSYYLVQLTQATTFFESEFCLYLCLQTDIDYDSVIDAAKDRFRQIPESLQSLALTDAARWWLVRNGK